MCKPNSIVKILHLVLIGVYFTTLLPQTAFAENSIKCFENTINQSLLEKGFGLVEGKLRVKKEWEFSEEIEKKFAAIFTDPNVTNEQKIKKLFEAMVEERLNQLGQTGKFFFKSAVNDALKQKSIYSKSLGKIIKKIFGPHYNTVFNRISMDIENPEDFKTLLVAFHEIEHAFDRNSNPLISVARLKALTMEPFMIFKTPISPALTYRMESRALGAQWEIVSRIPKDVRNQILENIAPTSKLNKNHHFSSIPSYYTKEATTKNFRKIKNPSPKDIEEYNIQLFKDAKSKIKSEKENLLSQLAMPIDKTKAENLNSKIHDLETITDEQIKVSLEHWKKYNLLKTDPLVNIAKESLLNADLSKEEFIKKMEPIQDYSVKILFGEHYTFKSIFRINLATLAFVEILSTYSYDTDGTKKERTLKLEKETISPDIKFMIYLYSILLSKIEEPQISHQ